MAIKHNQWKHTEVKEMFCFKRHYHLELKSMVSHHHYVILKWLEKCKNMPEVFILHQKSK